MNVYLLCRVFEDGDGYSQEEPLEIFENKDNALEYARNLFLNEEKKRLYDEDGNKKEYKRGTSIEIMGDGSRVEKFEKFFLPDIYYDRYDIVLSNKNNFVEKFVAFETDDMYGVEFILREMEVK